MAICAKHLLGLLIFGAPKRSPVRPQRGHGGLLGILPSSPLAQESQELNKWCSGNPRPSL